MSCKTKKAEVQPKMALLCRQRFPAPLVPCEFRLGQKDSPGVYDLPLSEAQSFDHTVCQVWPLELPRLRLCRTPVDTGDGRCRVGRGEVDLYKA